MNLQGRNLSLQTPPAVGDDVKLLQHELAKLGFNLPADEVGRGVFGPGTRDTVQQFQDRFAAELHASGWPGEFGVVEAITAQFINREVGRQQPVGPTPGSVVRGVVRHSDGKPFGGAIVAAVDQDLRGEKALGQTTTNADGRYEIRYAPAQPAGAEKRAADVVVRVLNVAGAVLAASPTLFNAPQEATIDLLVPDTAPGLPSEYERLVRAIEPLLTNVTVPGVPALTLVDKLADLKQEEMDFLANEAGIQRQKIGFLVAAAHLQQQATRASYNLPGEVFYGLAREGLPTDLAALGLRSQQERSDALDRALKDNIIPAALRDSLPALFDQLQRLAVSQALHTPPPDGAHSLGDLLGTVVASPQQQATLLALSNDHVGTPEEFWKNLRAHPDFQEPGVVDRLQLTLQLGLLTQNHLPLIQQLQQMDIKSTRDLVKLDAASWRDLIRKQIDGRPVGVPPGVPGDRPEEKTANYVRGIVSTLQAAFPTETVAQIVAKAPNIGIDGPIREAVERFFGNSPDFDLRSSRIDNYVSGHPDALNGVAEQDKPKAVEQLKRLQRAFQVSTSSDTMSVLLSQGLDSALAIANIPRSSFVEQYKTQMGGEAQAQGVYERAVAINSRTLQLYGYLNDALNGANPEALNIDQQAVAQAVVKHIPNYTELFGSLDLCDCQQCQSVFSPAAYLVDLLEFLRRSKANGKGKTPLDVLLGRRPDLANLHLTCENTNTTLPYVDLVNEVLESYLALGKPDASAAHNTENVTTPELDANPQYTLDEAYKALDQAVYPFTLPFNLPVAISRVYLEHLGSSRAELLNTFQTGTSPAVLRARAAEYLKITAEEYPILTGANFDASVAVQARPMREFYGYESEQVNRPKKSQTKLWKDWLADVPEFLQRTGIAYTDLVELLKTRFINPAYPQGEALTFFLRIPLSFATLNKLVQSNFANPDKKNLLDPLQEAGITLQQLIDWANANFQKVAKLIVLDAPDSKCDLNVTRLQHLDTTLLDDAELGKLHRLIRLWRKLGWSIADLDRVLSALKTADITPDALSQFAQIKQLQNDLNISNLQVLLSFWASINTRGDDSLYKKLFLSKAALRTDPDFEPEKKDGSVLAKAGLKISDHIPALLAALRVNATDFAAIRVDAHLDADTKPLTLENVSILYRYAALGRALRLRVGDLLSLKTLSGIDPFATPAQTIQFATLAGKVQQSGFAIAQLNYLYRHLTAPPANLAPQSTTVLLLAKALRDGLGKIGQDNALAPDPVGDLTRTKLALLFDAATVDQTITLINGSALYAAPLAKLPDAIAKKGASNKVISIDPAKVPALVANKVSYDPKASMLRFQGAMTTDEQTALKNASADVAFQAAVNNLYQQSSTFVQSALIGFLDVKDAEKNLLRATRSLDQDLQPVLLDEKNNPTDELKKAVNTVIAQKFAYLLAHFLPYLRDQLSRMFVKQIIGDALKLDAAVAQALLETALKSADSKQNAIADELALAMPGLTAEYFTSNNLSGTPTVRTDPARVPDPADKAKAPLPPGTGSARWSGMVLSPANGEFTFAISGSTKVQMWLGEDLSPVALQLDATTSEMVSQPVPLKTDQLYNLRLEFSQLLPNAVLELRWQSATVPKTVIPVDNLYPRNALDKLATTFTRLQKAALVVNTFKLIDPEVAYFSSHSKDFDGFDLNALPLTRDDSDAKQIDASASALFKAWQRVRDYVTLRDSLPQGDVNLIDVFGAASLKDATLKLAQATGWDRQIVDVLTGTDGFKLTAADFKNEIWVTRLQASVRLVKRLGASVPTIFTWASINADFQKLLTIAQDVKKSVHAKYDEESWLAVAKPLNDKLRESQRDALVAYLLPRLDLSDSNQLFEFFLIDVDMSACMETSRIKQAISSVQLFVQRCLMNLEQRDGVSELSVSPSQIDWDHWQWMKHYRVWEANRKVFLYPENWIEPELRDDKSPFFKELESELLQNEITQDTVETAFVNYLEKLDQVARLEICGMYWENEDPDKSESVNVLHVFGRTFNTPHIYYYRRLLNNTAWTSWEKVQVDIEGDQLICAMFNRRLYLFWPILNKSDKQQPKGTYLEARLAWSELRYGKWSPKQISNDKEILQLTGKLYPDSVLLLTETKDDKLTVLFALSAVATGDDAGKLIASRGTLGEFDFAACSGAATKLDTMRSFVKLDGVLLDYLDDSSKSFNYTPLGGSGGEIAVLRQLRSHPRLDLGHLVEAGFTLPFFYQDDLRAFFVTPHPGIQFVDQVAQSGKVELNKYAQFTNKTMALVDGGDGLMAAASSQSTMNNWASQESASQSNWSAGASQASRWQFVFTTNLSFAPFWHPFVCKFIKALKRRGVPALLTLGNQQQHEIDILYSDGNAFDLGTLFERQYKPTDHVDKPYPFEEVDFSYAGSYSLYNWELFFHAPLLIGTRLSKNQRFEAAQHWFHCVFDPTDGSGQFWKVSPFTTAEKDRIEDLLLLLSTDDSTPEKKAKKDLLIKQWEELKDHPFQPHLIARLRYSAYMKNVFMKYLDNLIAWGDQLFRQDTIESINEATQLYVLAADLLGPRPQRLPRRGTVAPETYTTLKDKLDKFSNALVSFENDFPFSDGVSSSMTGESARLLGLGQALYFCIPQNDKLLGYWDTVGDRLFKIRHCMNIEGVVRELPLFEPPIDPALLVQAAAKGVDLSSVLNDLSAPLPYYRFSYLLQKALEACADVKALGAALLSELEKTDAESFAALKALQETEMLKLITQVKEDQIQQEKETQGSLEKAKQLASARYKHYQNLLGNIDQKSGTESDQGNLLEEEGQYLLDQEIAATNRDLAESDEILAHYLFLIPDMTMTFSAGPPSFGTTIGGSYFGRAAEADAAHASHEAGMLERDAAVALTRGQWKRRDEDWKLQRDLANIETAQIDKQIGAAKIRVAIAELDRDNHKKQVENAQQIEDFLRNKFTNVELYAWMQGEIAALYFQSHQMAYDLAKKAERAFRFERGLTDSNFIQFGYWDSLRKGLLAGERLYLALKQMERSYHDQNKREYEITRHVSLQLHDPMALITLKQTGQCEIFLPESLFDADYPGHYMRRIKSVSLTLPCVVGPYTSINCKLTLLSNKTRIKSTLADGYLENQDTEDSRFVTNFAAMQSIATSHAQNDSGLFELNFRDERYLPFEGAGAISRWRLELPKETNAFDLSTVTDVVLHLRYTAREGGEIPRKAASQALTDWIANAEGAPLMRLLSSRHEFPSEWARFLRPTDQNATSQKLTLDLSMERFPYLFRGRKLAVSKIDVFLIFKDRERIADYGKGQPLVFTLTPEGGSGATDDLDSVASQFAGTPHKQISIDLSPPAKLLLEVKEDEVKKVAPALREVVPPTGPGHTRLRADAIDDLLYIIHYSVS